MTDILLKYLSGGIGVCIPVAILAFLAKNLLLERLKGSVKHECDKDLEDHKKELNAQIKDIEHKNQLNQLRTSLFFDHQRSAFAEIIETIADVLDNWMRNSCVDVGEFIGEIPHKEYQRFSKIYNQHKLFTDSECCAAINLIREIMGDSFPTEEQRHRSYGHDTEHHYDRCRYVENRLPDLFQEKIGLDVNRDSKVEIAYLGAMLQLNSFDLSDYDLLEKKLVVRDTDTCDKILRKARDNRELLIVKLKWFVDYSQRDGCFSYGATEMQRYLDILEAPSE